MGYPLAEYLVGQGLPVAVLHGKLAVKQRKRELAAWHGATTGAGRVLVATGRYVGEGFDDPLLDTLVLASPVSWRGTLVQYVGRLTRVSPGKAEIVVYDYVDGEVAALRRMFERRKAGYRELGFGVVVGGLARSAIAQTVEAKRQ